MSPLSSAQCPSYHSPTPCNNPRPGAVLSTLLRYVCPAATPLTLTRWSRFARPSRTRRRSLPALRSSARYAQRHSTRGPTARPQETVTRRSKAASEPCVHLSCWLGVLLSSQDYNKKHFVRNETFPVRVFCFAQRCQPADTRPGADLLSMHCSRCCGSQLTCVVRLVTCPPQPAAKNITGATRKIFIEFLERSCTAEFSGFLLYKVRLAPAPSMPATSLPTPAHTALQHTRGL